MMNRPDLRHLALAALDDLHANNRLQQRRLPRAARPQQATDRAASHVETNRDHLISGGQRGHLATSSTTHKRRTVGVAFAGYSIRIVALLICSGVVV
jgi:hypothetical protein